MASVASGVDMSSRRDEEMWYQSMLHQCLGRVKEIQDNTVVIIIVTTKHVWSFNTKKLQNKTKKYKMQDKVGS
jgi:hypothetical protein